MKKMSFFRLCFAITAFLILLPANVPAQELPRENGDADRQASEMAIRANVEQFAKAYNAHDAKAVANLFLIQAQIVDEFDNTIQGLERTDKPAFCFQGHPEASPGPHDIGYLFDRFIREMESRS